MLFSLASQLALLLLTFIILINITHGSLSDKVMLKAVNLTLHQGEWTTGRRTRPVPQLICIGGTNRCKFQPTTVKCSNQQGKEDNIKWQCTANLEKNLRFNQLDVSCEGYDFPEDDYVLKGSCGLEYSIDTLDGSTPPSKPHFVKLHGDVFARGLKKLKIKPTA